MILSTILSFFGGSAFRMLWGEISSYLTKKQDQKFEMERMELNGQLESAAHMRNIESLRVQAELGIKEIQVTGETKISEIEVDAWREAVKATTKKTGYYFIDVWNGIIRPFVASWAIVMISIDFSQKNWVMDDQGWMLSSAALGLYLADRALFKRGK